MFQSNMALLRERFPSVAELVEGAAADAGLEFSAARNGQLTGTVTDAKRGPQTIYSRMDPGRVARRDVGRRQPDGPGAVVALGVGLGYHLFALAERFPERPLAAVEARPALLRKSMEALDWSPLLKRDDFTLLAPGSTTSEFPEGLLEPKPDVFAHPVLFKVDLEFYYPFYKALKGVTDEGGLHVLSFAGRGDLVPYALMDVQETLRDMGHEVHVVDISEVTREREFFDAVWTAAMEYCPDFIVTVDALGLCDEILGRLGVPIAAWFFDNPFGQLSFRPEDEGPRPELLGDKFHVFSWDEHYVPLLRERGVRAHYLPLAANPRIYRPREGTAEELERYGADVSFIGTARREADREYRLASVESLGGLDVALWGAGWEQLRGSGFRRRGAADNRMEAPLIFSLSKINLNFTTAQLVTALPMRVFDILACGGFLLTDYREDLGRLFEPGSDMAVFGSKEELRELAEFYLAHPGKRDAIGRRGRGTVLGNHTFRHRMDSIMKTVFGDKR